MKSEILYKGRVVRLRREQHTLPDGRKGTFEIIRHSGAAAVVPLREDGQVVLIHQFRPAAGGMVWEIPAGRLEPGEEPLACAARELEEEIGCRAGVLEPLGSVRPALGYSDEIIALFVGRELTPTAQALDPDEYLTPTPLPLAEALAMVEDGRIDDSKTQVALLLLARKLGL